MIEYRRIPGQTPPLHRGVPPWAPTFPCSPSTPSRCSRSTPSN